MDGFIIIYLCTLIYLISIYFFYHCLIYFYYMILSSNFRLHYLKKLCFPDSHQSYSSLMSHGFRWDSNVILLQYVCCVIAGSLSPGTMLWTPGGVVWLRDHAINPRARCCVTQRPRYKHRDGVVWLRDNDEPRSGVVCLLVTLLEEPRWTCPFLTAPPVLRSLASSLSLR